MRGNGRIFQRGRIYWIAYSLRGTEYRESAKTEDPKAAEKFLKHRMREVGADQIGARTFVTPAASRLTIGELVAALEADFELKGKLSAQNRSNLKRVAADFGQVCAIALTPEKVDAYIEQRLAVGDAKASINRSTQLLAQSYRLAILRGHLSRAPHIRRLSESGNARQGFFSEQELAAVIAALPDDLKDFVRFAAVTGMRCGEIKSLKWAHIDGDVLTLQSQDSKNDEARSIPLVGELAGIIERRRAFRQVQENGTTRLVESIFHRDGLPVAEFRKSWATACRKAGVIGRLFHDLRRTAVRNMVHAGVGQAVAMRVSGHKTASMFQRYNILVTDDLRQALVQTEEYRKGAARKVVSMP